MLEASHPVSPEVARAVFVANDIPEAVQVGFWLILVPTYCDDRACIPAKVVNAFVEKNKN